MVVRDYLVCTRSAMHAVQAHVQEALQAWSVDWMGACAGLAVECAPFETLADERQSQFWWHCHGQWGSVWVGTDAQAAMSKNLFGDQSANVQGAAADVVSQAMQALLEALADSTTPPTQLDALPPTASAPGRQTMRIGVSARELTLELIMQANQPYALPSSKKDLSALTPLDIALSAQPVPLHARLGETEIDLGALEVLAVGDVIRLDRQLDQPAELTVLDKKLPCQAYLGTLDGRIAVEVGR